jgi:hypothetical protein
MKTKVVPLKWNAAGARWSAGLQWNGVQTILQTMITKAIVDFSHYVATELNDIAQPIHDQMLASAATFTAPPISMVALATLISTYTAKLSARASNASADVFAFQVARAALEGGLHELGGYVNYTAKGDAAIVLLSGFPSYTVGAGAAPGPSAIPAGPQNVKLGHGALSGSIIARFKPDRQNSFNVAQICTGDPSVEANWKPGSQGTGGKITITGLTPGTILWVRIATVGPGGQLGAWSDPAKIVVA